MCHAESSGNHDFLRLTHRCGEACEISEGRSTAGLLNSIRYRLQRLRAGRAPPRFLGSADIRPLRIGYCLMRPST